MKKSGVHWDGMTKSPLSYSTSDFYASETFIWNHIILSIKKREYPHLFFFLLLQLFFFFSHTMDTNTTFLSLTSAISILQLHHEEDHPTPTSTHDSVEWFLYGAEDHSLLQNRPPTTFLKLTSEEDDEDDDTLPDLISTHETSWLYTQ